MCTQGRNWGNGSCVVGQGQSVVVTDSMFVVGLVFNQDKVQSRDFHGEKTFNYNLFWMWLYPDQGKNEPYPILPKTWIRVRDTDKKDQLIFLYSSLKPSRARVTRISPFSPPVTKNWWRNPGSEVLKYKYYFLKTVFRDPGLLVGSVQGRN